MKRITEDFQLVEPSDYVWEIMYRYVNPEFSRAEPERRLVNSIPGKVKIWFHQSNCRLECFRRNKSVPYQLYEQQKFLSISFQENIPVET